MPGGAPSLVTDGILGRAGAIASDWFLLGRVRPFEEIQAAINSLTPESIVEHVRNFPAEKMTLVTLGPKALAPC